jgi:hypothetical protein
MIGINMIRRWDEGVSGGHAQIIVPKIKQSPKSSSKDLGDEVIDVLW